MNMTATDRNRAAKRRYLAKKPWAKSLDLASGRCNRPSAKSYPNYGGRGIKMLLSMSDVEFIWNRDGAAGMDRPSLDRINSDGHYEFGNCRFIELVQNSRNGGLINQNVKKTHCINGHEFSEENNVPWAKDRGWRQCLKCKRDRDSRRDRSVRGGVR